MMVTAADIDELERLLRRETDFDHLWAKKLGGSSIAICSGKGPDQQDHALLTRIARGTWGLSFSHHTGRWERTPFVGSMDEIVTTIIRDFSFHLEQW